MADMIVKQLKSILGKRPSVPDLSSGRKPLSYWRLLWVVAVPLLIGACSQPEVRKGSFMTSAQGVHKNPNLPVGLNPLGSVETCLPAAEAQPPGNRVLVSRPEYFTEEASKMIANLREVVTEPKNRFPAIEFQLADRQVRSDQEARFLGLRCGALIVLWEPFQTKTLVMTLPHPSQIPLRQMAQKQLCEYGSHQEQLSILYLTIAGLLTMRKNDYEKAVFYMKSAQGIDNGCLHLPLPGRSKKPSQVQGKNEAGPSKG